MNTEGMEDAIYHDVMVLAPKGMVFNRKALVPLYLRLTACEQKGYKRIVVDLSEVKGFGAALVGWLVTARQRLTKTGGEVVLVGLSRREERILKVSKLSKVFRHFKTVDQAVAGFDRHDLYQAA